MLNDTHHMNSIRLAMAAKRVGNSESRYVLQGVGDVDPAAFNTFMNADDRAWIGFVKWPNETAGYDPKHILQHLHHVSNSDQNNAINVDLFVWDRTAERVVGYATLAVHHGAARIGYFVLPSERGQGIAKTMVKSIENTVSQFTGDLQVHSMVAEVFPDNVASMKVLEKSGYTNLGLANSQSVGYEGKQLAQFQKDMLNQYIQR